jgi:hypothetical protein
VLHAPHQAPGNSTAGTHSLLEAGLQNSFCRSWYTQTSCFCGECLLLTAVVYRRGRNRKLLLVASCFMLLITPHSQADLQLRARSKMHLGDTGTSAMSCSPHAVTETLSTRFPSPFVRKSEAITCPSCSRGLFLHLWVVSAVCGRVLDVFFGLT